MSNKLATGFILLFLIIPSLLLAQGQTRIEYDTYGISGFELYGNQMYYWLAGGNCGMSFVDAHIRIIPQNAATLPYTVNDCSAMPSTDNNCARDANYFYFPMDNEIKRIAVNATWDTVGVGPSSLPTAITTTVNGRIICYQGRLYWCEQSSLTLSHILSANVDGSDKRTEVTINGGLSNISVIQFGVYTYNDTSFNPHPAIFYITLCATQYDLYRHELSAAPDVSVHLSQDIYFFKPQRMADNSDRLFCLKQATIVRTAPYAYVWRLDPVTGTGVSLYLSPIANTLVSLDTDSSNIFWIENTNVASYNIYIKRKSLTAAPGDTPETIFNYTSSDCTNIRSDGSYIYYRDVDQIWKLNASAQPLTVDLRATQFEAVQAIQRLNPSPDVPLVVSKPTYVRGYAELVHSDFAQQVFRCGARLRGYRGTTELTGSPLSPLNDPQIGSYSSAVYTRYDVNRNFLFRLPASWMAQPGQLRLVFSVNPLWIGPEVESARANNTIEQTYTIQDKGWPCAVFIPVRVEGIPEYSIQQLPRFGDIIARAESFLPVRAIDIYYQNDDIAEYEFPWSYNGYELPDDQNWIQVSLWIRDQISADPSYCERTHYVGMVAPQEPSFNGIGMEPGDCLTFTARNTTTSFLPNSPKGGVNLAHEMGHNYRMGHMECDDGQHPDGPYNTDYPFDYCNIGFDSWSDYYGFDPISRTVMMPTTMDVGDLMSYRNKRWVSSYTWDWLLGMMPNYRSVGAKEDLKLSPEEIAAIGTSSQLFLCGFFSTKSGEFHPGNYMVFPPGTAPSAKVLRSHAAVKNMTRGTNPYVVRLLDSGSGTLSETPINYFDMMDDGSDVDVGFAQYVNYDDLTAYVQIADQSTTLNERPVSAHPPVLTLGAVSIVGHTLSLTWDCTDEDGDTILYTVQFSSDGGANYASFASNYPYTSYSTDADYLTGTTNARLRVIATDGILTDMEETPSFTIPRHAPRVVIGGIRDGDRIPFGTQPVLAGVAWDTEDGRLPDDELSWNVQFYTLPFLTGTGNSLTIDDLQPGAFSATLTATDSDDNTGSAIVNFEVLPLTVPDGSPMPVLDGLCDDAAYSAGTFVRIPFGDGSFANVSLVHAGGKLCVMFNNLRQGIGSATTFVGIRIDKNNSGDTWAQADDAGYFVDENGIQFQSRGGGDGSMNPIYDPPAGFESAVFYSGDSWSAELQIDESLIDGWNHAARIKLGQYWIAGTGDDRNWPMYSVWDMPVSWAPAWFGASYPVTANAAPVANAGPVLSWTISTPVTCTLSGSGSYDPDGNPITYSWSQLEGPAVTLSDATAVNPSFTVQPAAADTTYRFQLIVSDGALSSLPDEVTLTVHPAPAPCFTAEPSSGWAPLTVCFTDHSNGNGHSILGQKWDFNNDGIFESDQHNACFTYDHPGTYTAVLDIETDIGHTSRSTKIVAGGYYYPFDNAPAEGWEPLPTAGGTFIDDPLGAFYIAQTSTSTPSTIAILDEGASGNQYGCWELKVNSPMQSCTENYLYRARYNLETDQTNTSAVPFVRLRWNDTASLTLAAFHVDKGPNALTTDWRNVDSYFFKNPEDSCIGSNFLLYLDLIDFTPVQTGNIYCHSIEVTRQSISPTAGTLIAQYDTSEDFAKWGRFDAGTILDPITSGADNGSLWLESPGPVGSKGLNFGGWGLNYYADGPKFESGCLYSAVFTLHSESEDARTHLPMIRLRFSNKTYDWNGMRYVRQVMGTSGHMPAPGGTNYSIFIDSPPYLSGAPGATSDLIALDFDIVDGEASQYGRVYLDKVQVYQFPMP